MRWYPGARDEGERGQGWCPARRADKRLSRLPYPRPAPQGISEALSYGILRRLSTAVSQTCDNRRVRVHAHTNFSQLLLGVNGKVFIVIVAHKKPRLPSTLSSEGYPRFSLPASVKNNRINRFFLTGVSKNDRILLPNGDSTTPVCRS
jgi:hypothetical protein